MASYNSAQAILHDNYGYYSENCAQLNNETNNFSNHQAASLEPADCTEPLITPVEDSLDNYHQEEENQLLEINSVVSNNLVDNSANENLTVPNKRKRKSVNSSEKEFERIQKNLKKYPVLEGCFNCTKNCTKNILHEEREKINEKVNNLTWNEKNSFIVTFVKRSQVKRRTVNEARLIKERENTYEYYLPVKNEPIRVCKTFFLTTLGYKPNNDSALKRVLQTADPITLKPAADNRGKKLSSTSVELKNEIMYHIESYNPCVSHYRRLHAPNKRYLPSELTITDMHKDFKIKNPEFQISYECYRLVVAEMNISFALLGHEECESCEKYKIHTKSDPCGDNNCEIYSYYFIHKEKYTSARKMYDDHAEKSKVCPSDTIYYTVDLQKVIMLPQMECFKTCIFTKRIVVFNQSFVPIGSMQKASRPPVAVLWHEAIAGTKKEQIVSAFHNFFLSCRDKKKIILWLDNCTGQNKNWCLFSFLIYMVNSSEISADTIELNYF